MGVLPFDCEFLSTAGFSSARSLPPQNSRPAVPLVEAGPAEVYGKTPANLAVRNSMFPRLSGGAIRAGAQFAYPIGDPTYADAILDRIVHNAHRINLTGHSLRRSRATKPPRHPTTGVITDLPFVIVERDSMRSNFMNYCRFLPFNVQRHQLHKE
jgi:IstB-like ATP binding protein